MRFFKYILTLTLFLALTKGYGQDLDKVDRMLSNYPANPSSTEELANRIKNDFSNDLERVRAIYKWIALHVAYDTKALGKPQRVRFSYRTLAELEAKKKQFRKDLALQTLKKRKALCEGYSTLFQNLCQQMNIECEIVPGIARRLISEIDRQNLPSNHAWNAVKINGKWLLVDVTWAAGWVDYSKMKFHQEFSSAYFASDPNEFAMKHLPDDQKWLLTDNINSKAEFASQPIPYKYFLGKNIKLLSPQKGTINMLKSTGVQFNLQNVPADTEIAYHFKREKYGQKVKSFTKADTLSFKIYSELKGKDELVIYFNGEPALGYKVIVK
ncbi:transglutaminase domain-containing protein [Marinifilum caeruleilacunae]|uniref:Transglutaminase-like domain-containing protein n=1 Tax=Marinifilum caeruleilacunae TaxID=2499076 RepID=A0ABX1WYC4_9BACT|nr:transglutaminase domain-containing protein [Marinifilum caeruleilacunae]NOU60916.1 hypothetical protein [Marinifilum caeruleilacunae]